MVVHTDGLQLNQITSPGDQVHLCNSHPRHPGLISQSGDCYLDKKERNIKDMVVEVWVTEI